jgi:class 3 adenylate cyclase/tetratricopeptide (TPR) repeat protein
MPIAEQHDVISLTVLRQDGNLAASLTDSRSIARLGISALPETLAADLQRETREVLAWCADYGLGKVSGSAASAGVRLLGKRIFDTLLPGPVADFLRGTSGHVVSLQLDASLAWVPWEIAFDGEQFLGEKFALCRQILADEQAPRWRGQPASGIALNVLVLVGDLRHLDDRSGPQRLIDQLSDVEGLEVISANARDLLHDELLELIGKSHVVHYLGPLDGSAAPASKGAGGRREALPAVHRIASLPTPPALLISQNTSATGSSGNEALVAEASASGLSILTCEADRDSGDGLEFLLTAYRQLAQGATLAESVRLARSELHERSGVAAVVRLQAELYGEGRRLVVAKETGSRLDDNLRQVTIMSLDLVASTELMAELGAERYSEVLAEYHRRCEQIVLGCGGAPDDPQGDDGILCYFGFPVARENAASRAIRASLEIIDGVRGLGLKVRIGISTGQVVVRDGQPVGNAIHFAARLQSIAAPGALLVGESTRRIVKERFRFELIRDVPRLKGFDRPEPIFRVLGATQGDGPDDTGVAPELSAFIGRHRELQALKDHWTAARSGALRLVRIVGDAGIGKSRLVHEFKYTAAAQGEQIFECRCTPDHAHSAFRPIVEGLRRELRIPDGDAGEDVLDRVARLAAPAGIDGAVHLLADLLSLPLPSHHPVLDYPPARRRQLTLSVLVAIARSRLLLGPGCMIVEDVHWIDPSTEEFLNQLATDSELLPLLLIVTARSDSEVKWRPPCTTHEFELRGLSPEASRRLIVSACGDTRLPSEVVHLLAARADGVPLFIEESTRMVVELNAGLSANTAFAATMAVPTTILDLLTARLDRLGDAKQVAQFGGTIGREFPLSLLQAVLARETTPFPARDLAARLNTLVASGMLIRLGEGEDVRYVFKHVLMRDAAYRSLLERDRTRLHRVIADVITEQFRGLAESQPELLAFHFTEAGVDGDALRHWESAARQAAARSAHVEAINHVGSALAVLARVPPDEKRDRAELRLQLLLATRLIATEGYGADRVERVYARATELAHALGDETAGVKVLLGLEGYHFMRADFSKAHAIAVDAGAKAQRSGDAIHRVQSQWAVANILSHQGEMETAVRLMDECRAECDRIEHRPAAVQDPGVMCLCYSAWALWLIGCPDEALRRAVAVVELAEQLQHKFSVGEAYGFRAAVQHFRGENEAALQSAERAIEVCEDSGFVVWLAHARLMHGRIVAELGDRAAGIDEMRQAYDLWAGTGAVVTTPFYLALRAEGLSFDGQAGEGLALLDQALEVIGRSGERYYEAEVRRLYGLLVLQDAAKRGQDRRVEAEQWLRGAYDCAQSLRARSLGLRCATSLAELWASGRKRAQAIDVLASACQSMEEGTGTRDVVKARALLAALGREHAAH